MTKTVEFFFDFVSPTAYFAWHALPKICAKAGAELKYRPMFLGGVMNATGNTPPALVAAKGAWMSGDLVHWARKWGVEMNPNPHFPVNSLYIMRGACALEGEDIFLPYCDAMFSAVWREAKNMGEAAEIAGVVSTLGLNAEDFAATIQKPEIKQALKATTDEAVERGVFGAPSVFVEDELFFGQDRLFLVAEALGIHIRDVYPDY